MPTSTAEHDSLDASTAHVAKTANLVGNDIGARAQAVSFLEQLPEIVLEKICAFLAQSPDQLDLVALDLVARPLFCLARASPALYAIATRALMKWPGHGVSWLMPLDGFGEPDTFAVYGLPSNFECVPGSVAVCTVYGGAATACDQVETVLNQDPATTDPAALAQLAALFRRLEPHAPRVQPASAAWFLITSADPPEGAAINRVQRRQLVRIAPHLIRDLSFHMDVAPLPPFLTRLTISGEAIPMLNERVGVFRNVPKTLRELNMMAAAGWMDKSTLHWMLAHLPRQLEKLTLEAIHLDDQDAAVLALMLPPRLHTLGLSSNDFTATGALSVIAHAPPTLATLDVSENTLDRWGQDAGDMISFLTTPARMDALLAARDACHRVTSLSLCHSFATYPAALTLIVPALPPSLTFLDISNNCLSIETVTALVHRMPPALTHLGVAQCALDAERMEDLASALPWTLITLDLHWNRDLGDAGVAALLRGWKKRGPQFKKLDLRGCGVGDVGVQLLLEELGREVVVHLDGNKDVSDHGQSDVATARPRWTVNQVDPVLGG
ncbi:hypothetical protein AMAG_08997 [Allomyces macrogynus ATCC 38327]|uniref:F-box domain-containing protein n=1 Tax=Allomyces macrogynus (strain ATCC 38327) TaxID=578462 RepID=A0A0L0SNH6_ALLM3|nr:hypothetical protein AMAG_08997 [Allomyces macrogynus ATCC 38327]|eukprot:KNE63934.1 hypothetical protein AMAG_08997 [Allomyces macrogynus ATCC 38327]